MIIEDEFTQIASEARTYAHVFLRDYLTASEQDIPPLRDLQRHPSRVLTAFTEFLADNACRISRARLSKPEQKEFASWLVVDDQDDENFSFSIVLDNHQLTNWTQKTAMPVAVQEFRSLAHEFGHVLFSKFPKNKPGQIASVPPEDEEKAWVFATIFSGLLLGDYACKCRKSESQKDDSPTIFI